MQAVALEKANEAQSRAELQQLRATVVSSTLLALSQSDRGCTTRRACFEMHRQHARHSHNTTSRQVSAARNIPNISAECCSWHQDTAHTHSSHSPTDATALKTRVHYDMKGQPDINTGTSRTEPDHGDESNIKYAIQSLRCIRTDRATFQESNLGI